MPRFSKQQVGIWLIFSIVIIVIDQITKYLAESHLNFGVAEPVMPFFNLTLLYNTGAAFSILADGDGWQRWFFIILGVGVSCVLVIWLTRLEQNEKSTGWALSCILGGAIGNIIDRILYGHVIDFLDVYVGDSHWPAFNIADSAICIGVAILMFVTLFGGNPGNDSEKVKQSDTKSV